MATEAGLTPPSSALLKHGRTLTILRYPYINKYGSGDFCDPKVYPAGKGLDTAW